MASNMKSAGASRLSFIVGLLGFLGFLVSIGISSDFFAKSIIEKGDDFRILILLAASSFYIPFVVVRGIAWLVNCFTSPKNKESL